MQCGTTTKSSLLTDLIGPLASGNMASVLFACILIISLLDRFPKRIFSCHFWLCSRVEFSHAHLLPSHSLFSVKSSPVTSHHDTSPTVTYRHLPSLSITCHQLPSTTITFRHLCRLIIFHHNLFPSVSLPFLEFDEPKLTSLPLLFLFLQINELCLRL